MSKYVILRSFGMFYFDAITLFIPVIFLLNFRSITLENVAYNLFTPNERLGKIKKRNLLQDENQFQSAVRDFSLINKHRPKKLFSDHTIATLSRNKREAKDSYDDRLDMLDNSGLNPEGMSVVNKFIKNRNKLKSLMKGYLVLTLSLRILETRYIIASPIFLKVF